jgi:maltooligosyltrehalose trehalohydrolase
VTSWRPSLGAWREGTLTRFRVWAPDAARVDALIDPPGHSTFTLALARTDGGYFAAETGGAPAGSRYRYRLDKGSPLPDPASRFQPDGVHGPSQVVDASAFRWTDRGWTGLDRDRLVFYELHVGTFTPKGTFAAAAEKLPALAALGVTAVELMPVGDFAGARNWGYDGVALFAPARCYGAPDDLRRFVDAAHRLGLGVALDVVYNHLGPDGAYLGAFSRRYFTGRHHTPWGAALNFDDDGSGPVRAFFVENALHWIHEYHVDALRLDATHAIVDDSPEPVVAEIARAVHESTAGRALVVAEDSRNLASMIKPAAEHGWGLDAVWADDFHHACRRFLAGDADGYFADFSGQIEEIATALRRGWIFTGQVSRHLGGPRGTDPSGLPPRQFVIALQNHDQVGNRAFGERLHQQIDPAAWRAASVVLLTAPETPLLFMGQEWAASSPFLYFTDHHDELGRLVTEGRRREFASFAAFANADARERIPDPQAASTFARSRLDWAERDREPHAASLRLNAALLALRREEAAAGQRATAGSAAARALDETTLLVSRGRLIVVARLRGAGAVAVPELSDLDAAPVLTSEDAPYAADAAPIGVERAAGGVRLTFARPSAAVFRRG